MYVSVRDWRPARADPAAAGRRTISSTIILLGLTSLFTDISSEMVAAVLPLFATAQLALSPFAYGLVDGLYQGVSTFVRVGGGMAADGTGRPKAVAVAGYGLSAGCKLALLPITSGAALGLVVAVEWLDGDRIMYGLPREGSAETDVWVVPADGGGSPALYIPYAWSPSVVR